MKTIIESKLHHVFGPSAPRTPQISRLPSGSLAKAIEGEVAAKLKLAVVRAPNDYATRVSVRVSRTHNVLSTGTLLCAISVVPRGSINAVTTTISYTLTASEDA